MARLAGVSQPYVIRLFGTKQALFLATVRHASRPDRADASGRPPRSEPDLAGLGAAYDELLAERELITVLLHGFAAGGDPAIGPVVRETLRPDLPTGPRADRRDAERRPATSWRSACCCTVLAAMRVIGPGAVPAEPWMTEPGRQHGPGEGLPGPEHRTA